MWRVVYSLPSVRLAIFFLVPFLRNVFEERVLSYGTLRVSGAFALAIRVFAVYLIRILLVGRE